MLVGIITEVRWYLIVVLLFITKTGAMLLRDLNIYVGYLNFSFWDESYQITQAIIFASSFRPLLVSEYLKRNFWFNLYTLIYTLIKFFLSLSWSEITPCPWLFPQSSFLFPGAPYSLSGMLGEIVLHPVTFSPCLQTFISFPETDVMVLTMRADWVV